MSLANDLGNLRKEIDRIDSQLCELLGERFKLTQAVGEYKAINNLPATDLAREAEKFAKISELSIQQGVDPDMAVDIFRIIIDRVVANHNAIAGE